MKTIQLTKSQTEERLCRPIRVGELMEPLMNIISHPDRNNLIRDFFSSEDERCQEESQVATIKDKPRRQTRIIPLFGNQIA